MKVLVYGTLRKGGSNHRLLEDSKFLGETWIDGFEMFNVSPWFPGVIEGQGKVKGEVYEIDPHTFELLDTLEGYPDMYNRRLVPTDYGDAWIYLWNLNSRGQKIESGDYEK